MFLLLLLNVGSVALLSSPFWLTTAYVTSETHFFYAMDTEDRYPPAPSFRRAALDSFLIAVLPYVPWICLIQLVYECVLMRNAGGKGAEIIIRSTRFRTAYFLCWVVPYNVPAISILLYNMIPLPSRSAANPDPLGKIIHQWHFVVIAICCSVLLGLIVLARGLLRDRPRRPDPNGSPEG